MTLSTLLAVVTARAGSLAERDALDYTRSLGERHAAEVDARISSALGTAGELALALRALQRGGRSDRDEAQAVLQEMLRSHPDYVGMATAWEPQAFDGQDERFRGKGNSDATGRFMPYWYTPAPT